MSVYLRVLAVNLPWMIWQRSELFCLSQEPVRRLSQIDGGFVRDLANDPIDYAMVNAINGIGHVMDIRTIAEFVENDDILEELRQLGVDYAQGFGISKPQPLDFYVHNHKSRSNSGSVIMFPKQAK